VKKGFFILILVLTINISAPAGNNLYQRQRHLIEYTQETNHRSTADDVLVRNKTVMYIRYAVLANRILLIDLSGEAYSNSS
jgi:hypothetical protein